MASQQTLEALATWARTFDGSENATAQTLSKDLATAFSTISETPCTPHNLLRRLKRWYAQELSRDVRGAFLNGRGHHHDRETNLR